VGGEDTREATCKFSLYKIQKVMIFTVIFTVLVLYSSLPNRAVYEHPMSIRSLEYATPLPQVKRPPHPCIRALLLFGPRRNTFSAADM
jgi:hypothetical protein